MRVGVFTPLLSQLPLPVVLKKLGALHIDTVELATGNYVGDAHCKLSMLENPSALAEFQKILDDHGTKISALSCHGNPLHPDKDRAKQDREVSRKTILLAEKLGVPMMVDFSGMSRRFAECDRPQLGYLSLAARLPQGAGLAVERSCRSILGGAREVCS